MGSSINALSGFTQDLFAGIPVKDLKKSLAWYERLFGCPPSFFPNESEAVWQLGEHHWLYLIVQPQQAGGSVHTLLGGDLERLIAELAARGLQYGQEERPAPNVRKVMYFDPDGNEIGFGSVAAE